MSIPIYSLDLHTFVLGKALLMLKEQHVITT